jgi:hypothetical protein
LKNHDGGLVRSLRRLLSFPGQIQGSLHLKAPSGSLPGRRVQHCESVGTGITPTYLKGVDFSSSPQFLKGGRSPIPLKALLNNTFKLGKFAGREVVYPRLLC